MLNIKEDISNTEIFESETVRVELSPILTEVKDSLQSNHTKENIKEIVGEKVDAFRVLAAGTQRCVNRYGKEFWRSPGYTGVDSNGLSTGAIYRVAAGAIALSVYPQTQGIVGSRYIHDTQVAPCKVMKQELVQVGIKDNRLISDLDTYDTVGEIIRLIEVSQERGWQSVVCITNSYHLERVSRIIDSIEWLLLPHENTYQFKKGLQRVKEGKLSIQVVSAEEILKKYRKDIFDKYVKKDMNTSMLETRTKNESKGITNLKEGIYFRYDEGIGKRVELRKR